MHSFVIALTCMLGLAFPAVAEDEPLTRVLGPAVWTIDAGNDERAINLRIVIDENGRYRQTGTIRFGDTVLDMDESGVMVRQGPDLLKIFDSEDGGFMRWHINAETETSYTVEECIGLQNVAIHIEREPEE